MWIFCLDLFFLQRPHEDAMDVPSKTKSSYYSDTVANHDFRVQHRIHEQVVALQSSDLESDDAPLSVYSFSPCTMLPH